MLLEVKEAIYQMGLLKSPSQDGMPALFCHKYWNIIGSDVTELVLNFLNNGDFLDEINQTFIALIHKIQAPQNMSQLRPISLCNVIYKIISRVLTNTPSFFAISYFIFS